MITRRGLISGTGLAIALPRAAQAALPVPPGDRIGFRLVRNGDVIGSHALGFTRQGDTLVVSVAIDIQVKLLGIPLYRYSHRATERWQGDRFMSIDSRTDRDGSPRTMQALRGPDGLVHVTGTLTEPYVAPEGVLPSTYWNKAMLRPQLINSENGRLMQLPLTPGNIESVPMASGQTIQARRYDYGGELDLVLWYDMADQWAHLEFTKDGTPIIYQKL
jgi:hypothetical protein